MNFIRPDLVSRYKYYLKINQAKVNLSKWSQLLHNSSHHLMRSQVNLGKLEKVFCLRLPGWTNLDFGFVPIDLMFIMKSQFLDPT